MKNKKIPVDLFIFVAIVFPIIVTILTLNMCGKISLHHYGFALDSKNNLYIGEEEKIKIYNKNKLIGEVPIMTSKGYSFTIKDDKIIIAASLKEYVIDLNGKILEENDDSLGKLKNKMYSNRNQFKNVDGKEYVASNIMGLYCIKLNGDNSSKIIYENSKIEFVCTVLLAIVGASFFVVVPIIIYKWKFK